MVKALNVIHFHQKFSDIELVTHAKEGTRWAFEAIYRSHVEGVFDMLLHLLGNPSDVEDAVQETFIIAFKELHTLKNPSALKSWLKGVAANQARRHFRRKKLFRMLGLGLNKDPELHLTSIAHPSTSPEILAELKILDKLLCRINTNQRLAWMLRYVEGYDLLTVAELCQCSLATVKRRISAAQQLISQSLDIEEQRDE